MWHVRGVREVCALPQKDPHAYRSMTKMANRNHYDGPRDCRRKENIFPDKGPGIFMSPWGPRIMQPAQSTRRLHIAQMSRDWPLGKHRAGRCTGRTWQLTIPQALIRQSGVQTPVLQQPGRVMSGKSVSSLLLSPRQQHQDQQQRTDL